MCMSSDDVEFDTANQDRAAALARWLEEDWVKRFQPWEQQMAGNLLNQNQKIADDVKAAQQQAQQSFEASQATAQRNLARYGGQMDADQAAVQAKSKQLGAQGAQIGAMESARSGSINRYDQLMQSMVNVGRGVQAQGLQGIQQGVGLEANRNQYLAQNSQGNSGLFNLLGIGAGLVSSNMILSDKNTKTNIRPASRKQALRDVEAVQLKQWDYRPGLSGGREEQGHIGGMAQDMPDSMTTQDKRQVDLGDTTMTLIGATQELARRVKQLESNDDS